MPSCVYCGHDAGAYDEHEGCVAEALEGALHAEQLEPPVDAWTYTVTGWATPTAAGLAARVGPPARHLRVVPDPLD